MNENSSSHVSKEAARHGKIGEHLVCVDLLSKGYNAYLVYDRKYDVLVEVGNKLYKIQVKTTLKPRFAYQKSKKQKPVYAFNVYRSGYKNGNIYKIGDIDLFALVALDSKHISYMPFSNRTGNLLFRVPSLKGSYKNESGMYLYPKIKELKSQGFSPIEIQEKMGINESLYYFHHKELKVSKGRCSGYYLDNFPIEKCLSFLEKNEGYNKKEVLDMYLHL